MYVYMHIYIYIYVEIWRGSFCRKTHSHSWWYNSRGVPSFPSLQTTLWKCEQDDLYKLCLCVYIYNVYVCIYIYIYTYIYIGVTRKIFVLRTRNNQNIKYIIQLCVYIYIYGYIYTFVWCMRTILWVVS